MKSNPEKKRKQKKKNTDQKQRFWENMMGINQPIYERHNHAVRRKGR